MPNCPNCKKDVKRNGGACPECGQALSLHNGRYYREEDGSPAVKILRKWDELMSIRTSKLQGMPVTMRTSPKTTKYRRELAAAEGLLECAKGDLDMVLFTLEVLFTNPQFERHSRVGLAFLHDFDVGLMVAEGLREKQRQAQNRADVAFDQIMGSEDLFG